LFNTGAFSIQFLATPPNEATLLIERLRRLGSLGGRITAFCSHLRKRLTRLLKDRIDLQKPRQAGQDYIAIDWIELDPVADPTGFRGRDKGVVPFAVRRPKIASAIIATGFTVGWMARSASRVAPNEVAPA
jgi:hypothetical protein